MRSSDVDILMVPGWLGSGHEHWQSRWERNLSTARRIEQEDWITPDKDKWVGNIIKAVAAAANPPVLIAHSVGVIAVAHAGLKLPQGLLAGAFLVAPSDLDNARHWPVTDGHVWRDSEPGFAPVPLTPLPFPSMLLISADDPYCRPERARHFAAAWGTEAVEVGPLGHITAATGHGPWPEGVLRFGSFLGRLRP
jgi:serine hydrolase